MEVIVAKTAGFCFGVDRAVKKIYKLVEQEQEETAGTIGNKGSIYTYGPIIHNPQVVKELEEKGVRVLSQDDLVQGKLTSNYQVLIRSHGISESTHDQLIACGASVSDATCPYVKKIHRIVKEASEKDFDVIIVGNQDHPEIIGIAGWVKTNVQYINSLEDVHKIKLDKETNYSIVAQTTFNNALYHQILNELQKQSVHVIINETVCQATMDRQIEARELSKKVTKMIVIGGKNSSNTRKLYEICKRQCEDTYHIETIEDLVLNVFTVNDIIGITAGASTPKNIIEEVISNVRNVEF